MLTPLRTLAVAAALLGLLWLWSQHQPPLHAAGPFPEPRQIALSPTLNLPAPSGFRIEATDEYVVEAMIVSAKHYRSGREADLSPVDFALAWGRMTQEPTISAVRFSQSGRWYHFEWKGNPGIPVAEMMRSSANTHIIPATDDPSLRDMLLSLRRGDCVRLSGYLVRVTGDDGWRWNSSRTRADSGGHSCELMYVTSVDLLGL
jgi:hypothetical protein